MRELVIVIPDLYFGETPKPAARPRPSNVDGAVSWPGIEHVARFGSRSRLESGWRPWLSTWAGRADVASWPAASVAAAGARAENTVWIATPLHLQAGLTTLRVDRRSLLRLAPDELQELCSDFGRVFGESGLRLDPLASGEAVLSSPSTPQVRTVEPARFVDGDIAGALPEGPGSGYLRRLGAEIEMWLHEHPVNQARLARRDLPVSTFWLWGNDSAVIGTGRDHPGQSGGRSAREAAQGREFDAFGADAYLQGVCRLLNIECRAVPESLAVLESGSRRGAGGVNTPIRGGTVIVVRVGELWRERGTFLDALNELDHRFIEPARRALRAGSYGQVSVLANDRLTVLRERDHLRLWRRPRSGLEAFRWT